MASRETIVYLALGDRSFQAQAMFSAFSARRFEPAVEIVAYTDDDDLLRHAPIGLVHVTPELLGMWMGGSDYRYRAKLGAIRHAASTIGGSILFVDTDTYFKRSPAHLFARIGPGQGCLHLREGAIPLTRTVFDVELAEQLRRDDYLLTSGERIAFPSRPLMWNSGVVGIHARDSSLLDEATFLADQLWDKADPGGPYGRKIHHVEQFSLGYVMQFLKLREAADIIYHYWLMEEKRVFSHLLKSTLSNDGEPWNISMRELFAHRPRNRGAAASIEQVKMLLRRMALDFDSPLPGVRRSIT